TPNGWAGRRFTPNFDTTRANGTPDSQCAGAYSKICARHRAQVIDAQVNGGRHASDLHRYRRMGGDINDGGNDPTMHIGTVTSAAEFRTPGNQHLHFAPLAIYKDRDRLDEIVKRRMRQLVGQAAHRLGRNIFGRHQEASALAGLKRTGVRFRASLRTASTRSRLNILPLAVRGISSSATKYSGMSYRESPEASRWARTSSALSSNPVVNITARQ